MANKSDIPPTRTIEQVDTPPDSARPTTAMLKADINSGATGDRNEVFDPALSPLGTDDEAAGTPPTPERIAIARKNETVDRWSRGDEKASAAHRKRDGFPIAFVGMILLVGVILLVSVSFFLGRA